jgi:hypothetical protein
MMEGALSRAISKRFETSFSLSPIHFETRSDEETLVKYSNVKYARKYMSIYKPTFIFHNNIKDLSSNTAIVKEKVGTFACPNVQEIN